MSQLPVPPNSGWSARGRSTSHPFARYYYSSKPPCWAYVSTYRAWECGCSNAALILSHRVLLIMQLHTHHGLH